MMENMQAIDMFELQQSQINDMIKKGKNGLTFNLLGMKFFINWQYVGMHKEKKI